MHKNSTFHTIHYFFLLLIFVIGTGLFFSFHFDRFLQFLVIVATAFAYFLWGIIHHYLEDNLYFKVVVEYFLIALLGTIVLLSLIYRA